MASTRDHVLAAQVSRDIAMLWSGYVRRVLMIGSRAQGCSRPDSDLDLVVVVELPPDAPPWNGSDFVQAGAQLTAALGRVDVPVDIRVRTTDRFAEARDVPGGVEWVAAREGLSLFEQPLQRPPVIRTPKPEVARQLTSSWIHHALATIESFGELHAGRTDAEVARKVVERLIPAVLTHHGIVPKLERDVEVYARQIPAACSIRATLESVARRLNESPREAATQAASETIQYLSRDPLQARVLVKATTRLQMIT